MGRADRLLPAYSALKGERLSEDGSPPGKAPHLWCEKMKLSPAVCCSFVKQSQQGPSEGWPRQPEGLSSKGQLSNSENLPTTCGQHSFNATGFFTSAKDFTFSPNQSSYHYRSDKAGLQGPVTPNLGSLEAEEVSVS